MWSLENLTSAWISRKALLTIGCGTGNEQRNEMLIYQILQSWGSQLGGRKSFWQISKRVRQLWMLLSVRGPQYNGGYWKTSLCVLIIVLIVQIKFPFWNTKHTILLSYMLAVHVTSLPPHHSQITPKVPGFIHVTSNPQHHCERWILLLISQATKDQEGYKKSPISNILTENMEFEVIILSLLDSGFVQNK